MKNKTVLFLFISISILSGCSLTEGNTPAASLSPTPIPSDTQKPALTSTPTPTATPTSSETPTITLTATPEWPAEIQGYSDLLGLDVFKGENGLFYFGDSSLIYDEETGTWFVTEEGDAIGSNMHEVQGEWETNDQKLKALIDAEKHIVYAINDEFGQTTWVGLDLLAYQNLEGGIWEGKTFSEIVSLVSDLRNLIKTSNPEVFTDSVGSRNTDTSSSMVDIFCNSDSVREVGGVIIDDIEITFIDINLRGEVRYLMVWLDPYYGGQNQLDLINSGKTLRFGLYHSVENVKAEDLITNFRYLVERTGVDLERLKENVEAINSRNKVPDWEFLENTVIFARIREF